MRNNSKNNKIKIYLEIIGAIVVTGTLIFGIYIYFDTQKSLSDLEEMRIRLEKLDERIEETKVMIKEHEYDNENFSLYSEYLINATIAYNNAVEHWNNHDFEKGNENIKLSYNYLNKIPITIEDDSTVWYLLILLILIILIILGYLAGRTKKKP